MRLAGGTQRLEPPRALARGLAEKVGSLMEGLAESRRPSSLLAAGCAWLAVVLVAPVAAATQVFHSPGDDGAPAAGEPTIDEGGIRSVFLYVDGGAASSSLGTPCDDGEGDEVCGYSITLTGLGGLTISAFNADSGADLLVNQSAGTIVINGLDPVAPVAGPVRIGELQVNAVSGGAVELSSGEVVGADLGSEVLASGTIVSVPEPSGLLALASGSALLGALARRRASRC
jgi:hypothetical protein